MRTNRGHLLTLLLVGVAMLGTGELMVRFIAPQAIMVPRYSFSEKYNTSLSPGTRIRNEKPGAFQFFYTINDEGYRGPVVSTDSARSCIVILGDSYSLGIGVNDGEEYPARMREVFRGRRDVVNLGVGGWGLPQQIRRYYEFGETFHPEAVVLQFSGNDPFDGILYPVTRWENGVFTFHPVRSGGKRYAKFLTRSPLQYSQVYNFVRNQIWLRMRRAATYGSSDRAEESYVALLVPFAEALTKEGIDLIFISVEHSTDSFVKIRAAVNALDRAGQLHLVETGSWLEGLNDYASPEGHAWGTEAHRRIGEGLGHWIEDHLPATSR